MGISEPIHCRDLTLISVRQLSPAKRNEHLRLEKMMKGGKKPSSTGKGFAAWGGRTRRWSPEDIWNRKGTEHSKIPCRKGVLWRCFPSMHWEKRGLGLSSAES